MSLKLPILKLLTTSLWLLMSLFLGILLAEFVAQIYVYKIAKRGKLMQPDAVLGWKHLSNLNLERLNSDGQLWHIATNNNGFRTPSSWNAQAQTRILILGDSFAFGEGVDQEKRFDQLMALEHPSWSIRNLGVMGYGTDQQLLAGEQLFPELRAGDVLILLSFSNDYVDILRQRFAGRAKPWFEYGNGSLRQHPPSIGLRERIRDASYLASKLFSSLEPELYDYSAEDVKKGVELYKVLIPIYLKTLVERGVQVLIAHHGEGLLGRSVQLPPEFFEAIFTELSSHPGVKSVSLEAYLHAHASESLFLKDGHWNSRGHSLVAEVLTKFVLSVTN